VIAGPLRVRSKFEINFDSESSQPEKYQTNDQHRENHRPQRCDFVDLIPDKAGLETAFLVNPLSTPQFADPAPHGGVLLLEFASSSELRLCNRKQTVLTLAVFVSFANTSRAPRRDTTHA